MTAKKAKKKKSERPAFPGVIFVKIEVDGDFTYYVADDKPENLFTDGDETVRIAEFGLDHVGNFKLTRKVEEA